MLGATAAALLACAPAGAAPKLQVGVGRADITPPTGYYMMGWVRSDARGHRPAHAPVGAGDRARAGRAQGRARRRGPERDPRRDADRRPRSVTAKLGFSRAKRARLRLPHARRADRLLQLLDLQHGLHDHQLADRLRPRRLARPAALRLHGPPPGAGDPPRRRRTSVPARWAGGRRRITNLTENRSLEAHLYDHGIHEAYGTGSVSQDPKGRLHTIDPEVNVLRVDKRIGGRDVPVGMWSTFANHGTVNKFQFTYYNEDHHGAATHLVEAAIRRSGRVPAGPGRGRRLRQHRRGRPVRGPRPLRARRRRPRRHGRGAAPSCAPGARPAAIWTRRPRSLAAGPGCAGAGSRRPPGPVADKAAFGLAEFTGSEEGRGPLFDVTRVPFEGDHLPAGVGTQGDKIQTPIPLDVPEGGAADGAAGRRPDGRLDPRRDDRGGWGAGCAHAVTARRPRVRRHRAVISGLANEYADYFTTPAGVRRPALRGRRRPSTAAPAP